VDAVAQSGANVKVVRRVVTGLGEKGVLTAEVLGVIETGLKDKEEKMGRLLGDENDDGNAKEADKAAVDASGSEGLVDHSHKPTPRTGPGHYSAKPNGVSKMDKRAIEQRIEEDRERNKRLRESVWAVTGDDDQELDKMWEEGSYVGDDEHVIAGEEADERLQFVRYHRATLGS